MEFEGSTQAKSWMFSEESIADCRRRAAVINNTRQRSSSRPELPAQRVRKFASGFHRHHANTEQPTRDDKHSTPPQPTSGGLSTSDQETLVRFHAHQIQTLVGPTALLTDLRTSQTVLSTAIMFFRRFYLSNSVVDMNPRKIATACALFASKCEDEKVEISLLSHATAVVELRVKNSPLCRKELHSVSITDIETAERDLMEALNYEFRCHHPDPSIRFLTMDIAHFLSEKKHPALQVDLRDPRDSYHSGCSEHFGSIRRSSARGGQQEGTGCGYVDYAVELAETAAEVAQRALIFSDIPFLYAPGHIAFAIVSIAMESVEMSGFMGDDMQDYLVSRHGIMNSEEEILAFSREVSKIIAALINCPHMDLLPTAGQGPRIVEQRAEELRRVLFAVSDMRMLRQMQASAAAAAAAQTKWTPPRMLSPEPQHPHSIHRPHPHYNYHYHQQHHRHHAHHYAHPQPTRRHYCGPPMATSSSSSSSPSTSFSTLGKRRSSCFDADFTPPRKLPAHRRMARVTPTIGYMHE